MIFLFKLRGLSGFKNVSNLSVEAGAGYML